MKIPLLISGSLMKAKGTRQKIFPKMAITPNWSMQNGHKMVNTEKPLNLMELTTLKLPPANRLYVDNKWFLRLGQANRT
ncbi:TPA: hypothetical protein EYN09_17265 [Candidatus Poribacteria bacterium]|nr:hypothetical protein [Candidatus Poribacteria bacterium]HIO08662.1 hypothetical protein [Candidatus Poribacteria bacterium]